MAATTEFPERMPMTPVDPTRRPTPLASRLESQREQVMERLQDGFAKGTVTLDELDERLDLAQSARSEQELELLVEDLPADAPLVRQTSNGTGLATPMRSTSTALVRREDLAPLRLTAIFGSAEKRGRWTPPAVIHANATFGSVEIDLAEAELPPGSVTEVRCQAVFGSVDVRVPKHIRVESQGVGIFGSFGHPRSEPGDPNAPVVRLVGRAIFGSVELKKPRWRWWWNRR